MSQGDAPDDHVFVGNPFARGLGEGTRLGPKRRLLLGLLLLPLFVGSFMLPLAVVATWIWSGVGERRIAWMVCGAIGLLVYAAVMKRMLSRGKASSSEGQRQK